MYCPKCGQTMILRDGHMYCEEGEMYLSQYVTDELQKAFPAREESVHSDKSPIPVSTNKTLYCPVDGCKLTGNVSPLACPKCRGAISAPILYQLIKRHPHRPDEF